MRLKKKGLYWLNDSGQAAYCALFNDTSPIRLYVDGVGNMSIGELVYGDEVEFQFSTFGYVDYIRVGINTVEEIHLQPTQLILKYLEFKEVPNV